MRSSWSKDDQIDLTHVMVTNVLWRQLSSVRTVPNYRAVCECGMPKIPHSTCPYILILRHMVKCFPKPLLYQNEENMTLLQCHLQPTYHPYRFPLTPVTWVSHWLECAELIIVGCHATEISCFKGTRVHLELNMMKSRHGSL